MLQETFVHRACCGNRREKLLPVFRNIKFLLKTRYFPKWCCDRITTAPAWYFSPQLLPLGSGTALLSRTADPVACPLMRFTYVRCSAPGAAWNQVTVSLQVCTMRLSVAKFVISAGAASPSLPLGGKSPVRVWGKQAEKFQWKSQLTFCCWVLRVFACVLYYRCTEQHSSYLGRRLSDVL